MKKYDKLLIHCLQNTFLPFEYEWTCNSCGYNVNNKNSTHKNTAKKRQILLPKKNMLNGKKFICIDVYLLYEDDDFQIFFEKLSELKGNKLKIKDELTEKYKNVSEFPNFGQEYYSKTAKGIYKIGVDSIKLGKWVVCYDKQYENINNVDLMASILTCLIDIC